MNTKHEETTMMSKKEMKTFDQLLELVLKQNATSQSIVSQLKLLTDMKQAYIGDDPLLFEKVIR